jgi:hypothetical protein
VERTVLRVVERQRTGDDITPVGRRMSKGRIGRTIREALVPTLR